MELLDGREAGTQHRVLGFPQQAHGPYMGAEQMLLLQLDTDWRVASPPNDGFMWGSGGRLHFVMPRADWDAGRFDRVEAALTFS